MNSNSIVISRIIEKSVSLSVKGILLFSLLSFLVCNVVFMHSYSDTFSYREWIWVLPAILLIGVIFIMGKGIKCKNFEFSPLIIGFLISNIIFVTVLLTYDTKPVSDWKFVWKAANQMAVGTFTDGLEKGAYMHEIPYQLGLAVFESFCIKIFGSSYWVFKILNLLLLNFITWSTYHFAKRKTSVEVANYAYASACLFLCYLMTVGQFTNHQLGFVLLYIAFYLYEKRKLLTCCFAGVSAAFLNFVRPMGIIVVLTILVYSIYLLLNKKEKITTVVNVIAFFISYKLLLILLDLLLLNMNYTDECMSKSTRNLYHKITYTTYESQIDGKIADFNYDYAAYNEAYKKEICDMMVNHPKEIIINITNKMVRFLGMFDYLFEMTYNHDESIWKKYPLKAVYSIQWFQYVIFLVLAFYGYMKYRHKNEIDLYQIFFVGNTFVYIFVEAFSSYRFVNYFYFLFLVGYGAHEFAKRNPRAQCI